MARRKKDSASVVADQVERAIRRGEFRVAALIVKEASLSEADFDEIMDGRPELREVYLSL